MSGDFRKEFIAAAKLLGLEVVEQGEVKSNGRLLRCAFPIKPWCNCCSLSAARDRAFLHLRHQCIREKGYA